MNPYRHEDREALRVRNALALLSIEGPLELLFNTDLVLASRSRNGKDGSIVTIVKDYGKYLCSH